MLETDAAFYSASFLDSMTMLGLDGQTDPGDATPDAGGGDAETMWISDVWIVHGEETWVWIEMKHPDDGGWVWTGKWKPGAEPPGLEEPKTVGG